MAERDPVKFIEDHLRAFPQASIREIARAAENDGEPIAWEQIATVRNRWLHTQTSLGRLPRIVPVIEIAPENEPVVAGKASCTNCGGMHWVSQCTTPFPEKPKPLTEEANPAAQEKPMEPVAPAVPVVTPPAPKPPFTPAPTQPAAALHESHLGRQRVKGMWIRRAYLNDLLDANPGGDPMDLMVKVRQRFGIGIDASYVWETCRIARQIHRLAPITERDEESRAAADPPLKDEISPPLKDEIEVLARQAADVMRAQGLTSFSLEISDGIARWRYDVRRSDEGTVRL